MKLSLLPPVISYKRQETPAASHIVKQKPVSTFPLSNFLVYLNRRKNMTNEFDVGKMTLINSNLKYLITLVLIIVPI
jgi:hypothetical protein